jgi:undecaprenyl-diphosphatase
VPITTFGSSSQFRKWLLVGFTTLLLGSFLALSSEVKEASLGQPELISNLDKVTHESLSDIRNPKLNEIVMDITALGSTVVLTILIFVLCSYLIFLGYLASAAHLALAGAGGGLLTLLLKPFFERARPDTILRLVDVQGYSYPSGHSLSSAAIYFTIALLCCQRLNKRTHQIMISSLFFVLVTLIGVSRVYLGVHYFSDVTAGILLGVAWASFLSVIMAFIETRRDVNANR